MYKNIFVFIIFFSYTDVFAELSSADLTNTQANDPLTLRYIEPAVRQIECRSEDGQTTVIASVRGTQIISVLRSYDENADGEIDAFEALGDHQTNPDFSFRFQGQAAIGDNYVFESVQNRMVVTSNEPAVYNLEFFGGSIARSPELTNIITGVPPMQIDTEEFLQNQREARQRVSTLQENLNSRDFILRIEREERAAGDLGPDPTDIDNITNSYSNYTYLRCIRSRSI